MQYDTGKGGEELVPDYARRVSWENQKREDRLTADKQAPPLLAPTRTSLVNSLSNLFLSLVDVLNNLFSALINLLNHRLLFGDKLLHLLEELCELDDRLLNLLDFVVTGLDLTKSRPRLASPVSAEKLVTVSTSIQAQIDSVNIPLD